MPILMKLHESRTTVGQNWKMLLKLKSAVSYALNCQIIMDDLSKPLDEESIKVTMDDCVNGLQELTPAFGASTDNLERCRLLEYVAIGPHCSNLDLSNTSGSPQESSSKGGLVWESSSLILQLCSLILRWSDFIGFLEGSR
ncbi:uncharacterized protein [Miscanthus floridulus]|uniref:uncharacterized protein isoform X2 n=1 Tax=Miscanthus floridulus TaxID=154761 RepID=UPI0034583FA1